MQRIYKALKLLFLFNVVTLILFSCKESETIKDNTITKDISYRNLSPEFKEYWFSGKAEITSYQLSQLRYGELREGTAVSVFVTEDFLPKEQVKANDYSENNIPVLKLNSTKKFITGIYPYSIMSSTFSPLSTKEHPIKISTSSQEWCGQVYMQLNNTDKFEILSHSYFEGEADQNLSLDKTILENELWNLIRINPEELPIGDFMMIPSFEYLRLDHKKTKAYKATASFSQKGSESIYTINYPNLPRQLVIYFNSSFPFEIEKWEESSFANPMDTLGLKTTATKIKRMRTNYWAQKSNKDRTLRDSLGL